MFLNINGGALFVREEGPQNGLPVIFIHGFPLSQKMWDPQIKALKKTNRVIAYDVRGHGQSDRGDGLYTIEGHVDDLVSLMDYLKIQKAVIVGFSMGGYIAQRFIERNPERVLALGLFDTKSGADNNEGRLKRFLALKDIRLNGLAPFAETSILSLFSEKTLHEKQEIVDVVFNMIMNSPQHGVMGTLLCLASRYDLTLALSGIKVPTLLLVGEHDVITPPDSMQEMAQSIKGCEIHIVPEAGHMSNLENPVFVNEALLRFLGGLIDSAKETLAVAAPGKEMDLF
ncbi:MAG: Alpha/beta hydrolase fold protein [uncultured bacterium]|nr:MAG: Alpha/beta hydrolase fold protein [uncultured bacterium]